MFLHNHSEGRLTISSVCIIIVPILATTHQLAFPGHYFKPYQGKLIMCYMCVRVHIMHLCVMSQNVVHLRNYIAQNPNIIYIVQSCMYVNKLYEN